MELVNELLLCLLLLQIKHLLVDWLFQTQIEIQEKGTYAKLGGLIHSGEHALGTYIVCLLFTPLALYLAVLDFILHYHIDWLKSNLTNCLKVSPTHKTYWFLMGADQTLHQFTYLLLAYLTVGVV